MCGSREHPYFPARKDSMEISRGGGEGGFQKPTILKEGRKINLNIPLGGGVQLTKHILCVRGMDIWWNNTVRVPEVP